MRVYAPCSANNRETNTKGDAQCSPGIRRNGLEERADIEGLTAASEEHIYTAASWSAKVHHLQLCNASRGWVSRTASNDGQERPNSAHSIV